MAEPTSRAAFAEMLKTRLPVEADIAEKDAGLKAALETDDEPNFTHPAYETDMEAYTLTEQ